MERKIEDIIESLRNVKDRPNKCTILIGAGCSIKADIPLASGFVEIIKKEHKQAYERAAEKTYPKCMAELAGGERRELIARYINRAKINWAHIAIAQLMKAGYIDRVLTVNFDPLVVKACTMVGLYPAVYDFAASQLFKPAYIPLHPPSFIFTVNTQALS
jgi:NAD-dependent SIR2 family protein deacetylase